MTIRNMTCNCCGASAGRFRQWWNRDNGFGQCGACTDWSLARGESLAMVRDMAGDPGVHRPEGMLEGMLRERFPQERLAALAGDPMRDAIAQLKGELAAIESRLAREEQEESD